MRAALLASTMILAQGAMAQATFHGSNARTGVYESAGPGTFSAVQWRFKTGGPVIGSPAISQGTVYIGSSDGAFYAIDEQTGAQKWKVALTEPISSSPAVADGLVYFLSYDGILYARSTDTGKLAWHFATGGERRFEAKGIHGLTPETQLIADPMDLFLSSPAVDHHRVYVGSSDGHVYALDAASGALLWSFETGGVVHASPAIADGTLFIGSFDSTLYALDAESGLLKWRFKAGDDPVNHNQEGFQSSPAVADGVVYSGCRDGHVYALDAKTGRKRWDYSTSQSWVNGTPTIRDGVVYVGTSDTHKLLALDARSGRLIYSVDAHALVFASAALAGKLLYVGAFNGRMSALDAATGHLAWQFTTDGATEDPLKLLSPGGEFGKAMFAPDFGNFLDMTVHLYKMFSAGAILSSAVPDGGSLYFGSADGNVYALH